MNNGMHYGFASVRNLTFLSSEMKTISPVLNHWLSREIPPVLYHYTGQSGLVGILESRELWCTHSAYLNDTSEFEDSYDEFWLALAPIETEYMDVNSAEHVFLKRLREKMIKLKQQMPFSYFVACFSKEKNDLSQYRAYSHDESGYSIGFNGEKLKQIVFPNNRCLIAKCMYTMDEKFGIFTELINYYLHLSSDLTVGNQHSASEIDSFVQRFISDFLLVSPLMKNYAFEKENEWRIVVASNLEELDSDQIGFRSGNAMIVPYLRLKLLETYNSGIQTIDLGPTPHKNESWNSLYMLLLKEGYSILHNDKSASKAQIWGEQPIQIHHSNIPYRKT